MRAPGLLVALLLAGCATPPRAADPRFVAVVTGVAVDFPSRDRGELSFTVQLPVGAPKALGLSWELFLDGVRFAAGLEGAPTLDGALVTVKTPLVSRHLPYREGDAMLDVGLRGEVDVGVPGDKLHFKDRREVPVHGRPMLNIPPE